MTRLLIVNADDFGLNESANEGIVQSHLAGAVTSTTLMVNAPAAEPAVRLAKLHPDLGVGLHFNLTWGRPVSDPCRIPALLDSSGAFFDRSGLARRLLSGRVPASQVVTELRAQVARFEEFGLRPTHIDSHQHVHAFGAVFAAVAQQCVSAGIPMRVPWVASGESATMSRKLRRAVLSALLSRASGPWRDRVRWNDDLGSVFDLGAVDGEYADAHYRNILGNARGEVFELMVHPVTDAAAMQGYTRVGEVGEAEWKYLTQGSLAGVASAAGFRLGNYRELAA